MKEKETIFFSRGRTKLNIGIFTKHEEKEEIMLFSKAGINWMEAGNQADFIVDNTDSVTFLLVSLLSGEKQQLKIEFSDFPQRETKTMRIRLSLMYINESSFDLIIEDRGFGELFPPSGKVIKKRIML